MSRLCPCFALLMLTAGCASAPPLPEHTLMLGEVVQVASTAEPGYEHALGEDYERFAGALEDACGLAVGGPEALDLALLRFSYYWHNAGAPTRETARWYPVRAGLGVAPGNLVEIDLAVGASGPDSRCPWVARIAADDLESGGCQYVRAAQGSVREIFNLMSPVGAAGSASLDCPGLAGEGWEPHGFGFYGATIYTRAPASAAQAAQPTAGTGPGAGE